MKNIYSFIPNTLRALTLSVFFFGSLSPFSTAAMEQETDEGRPKSLVFLASKKIVGDLTEKLKAALQEASLLNDAKIKQETSLLQGEDLISYQVNNRYPRIKRFGEDHSIFDYLEDGKRVKQKISNILDSFSFLTNRGIVSRTLFFGINFSEKSRFLGLPLTASISSPVQAILISWIVDHLSHNEKSFLLDSHIVGRCLRKELRWSMPKDIVMPDFPSIWGLMSTCFDKLFNMDPINFLKLDMSKFVIHYEQTSQTFEVVEAEGND